MRNTLCGLTLLVGGAFVSPSAQADVITLRADEWCPYNCAVDAEKPGYGIEIAKEILAKAGHTLEYKTMAWARALEECRKGTVVAVIGASKEEVPDFVFPDESIGIADNTFAVKAGNAWRYAGPGTLEKIKLGTIQSYGYGGEVGAYIEANLKDKAKIDVNGGDNALELNLKKLAAGRVDAVVDARPVLAYKVQQTGLSDKVELINSADPMQNYIAFSPNNSKSAEYAQLISKGIADMRASGRLKKILDQYNVSDWK